MAESRLRLAVVISKAMPPRGGSIELVRVVFTCALVVLEIRRRIHTNGAQVRRLYLRDGSTHVLFEGVNSDGMFDFGRKPCFDGPWSFFQSPQRQRASGFAYAPDQS